MFVQKNFTPRATSPFNWKMVDAIWETLGEDTRGIRIEAQYNDFNRLDRENNAIYFDIYRVDQFDRTYELKYESAVAFVDAAYDILEGRREQYSYKDEFGDTLKIRYESFGGDDKVFALATYINDGESPLILYIPNETMYDILETMKRMIDIIH